MLLSDVLFVPFLAGCWLFCLTDAMLTPTAEFAGLTKNTWIYLIAATFAVGALAWLVTRRSWRPGSRVAPQGPDDDPDFLRHLGHRIRGTSADPGE